ncbi:MAG: DUF882 domain-containing protein [Desulfuromonadales bacterium]
MSEKRRRHFLRQMSLAMLLMACGRPLESVHAAVSGARKNPPEIRNLTLRNLHTGEELALTGLQAEKPGSDPSFAAIDGLLRCHFTGEVHPIDRRLIEFVLRLHRNAGEGRRIDIISGYRSPIYNEKLRQRSKGVARNSLHLQGKAIDLRMPGIRLDRLRQEAIALDCGGVGYYPTSGFIHLDGGMPRNWQGV